MSQGEDTGGVERSPDRIAAIDQARAAAADYADELSEFYNRLVHNGVDPEHARDAVVTLIEVRSNEED